MVDKDTAEKTTVSFNELLKAEKDAGKSVGDHFGSNSRLWNAQEKLAVHNPQNFIDYYKNDYIQTVSEAWLGPKYQITT